MDKTQRSNNKLANSDNKYFQYSIINALRYDEILKSHQRVSKVRLYINHITGMMEAFHQKIKIGERLKRIIQQLH